MRSRPISMRAMRDEAQRFKSRRSFQVPRAVAREAHGRSHVGLAGNGGLTSSRHPSETGVDGEATWHERYARPIRKNVRCVDAFGVGVDLGACAGGPGRFPQSATRLPDGRHLSFRARRFLPRLHLGLQLPRVPVRGRAVRDRGPCAAPAVPQDPLYVGRLTPGALGLEEKRAADEHQEPGNAEQGARQCRRGDGKPEEIPGEGQNASPEQSGPERNQEEPQQAGSARA